MIQEQVGLKKVSGISIVTAFGLITMSSSIACNSVTSMNVNPAYYYEINNYVNNDNTVCNSSMLSKHTVGDIVSVERKTDFVQQHDKINVNLQITKIKKHVSTFEFEEEYEEI